MIWVILIFITGVVLSPLAWILKQHRNEKRLVTSFALLGSLGVSGFAFGLYFLGGSPYLESFPYRPKSGEGPSLSEAIVAAEKRLAENPMNGKGWEVIAPIYFRLGRMSDACQAYEKAIWLLGETAHRLSDYGEACAFSEENHISQKTRDLFEQALRLDPKSLKAHFYLAQAAQHDGNREKALSHLKAITDLSPPDVPLGELMHRMFDKLAQQDKQSNIAP